METSTEGVAESAPEAPVEPPEAAAPPVARQPRTAEPPDATGRGATEGHTSEPEAADPGATKPESAAAATAEPGAADATSAKPGAADAAVAEPVAADTATAEPLMADTLAADPATVEPPDAADRSASEGPEVVDPEVAEQGGAGPRTALASPVSSATLPAPGAAPQEGLPLAPGGVAEPVVPVGVESVASGLVPGEAPSRALPAAPASLSPSRAGDFMQCPLLYRFRVIDRLPEKPSEAATRGTLVHAVLERLFDAPAGERTAPAAKSLIPGQWDRLRESRPEVVELFADDPEGERLARWLGEAERLVERWFTLEDPTRLEPAERELFVETRLESGLTLRGIIDRVDVAPTGEVRIVDYKTGKAPRPEYAEGALFQMKFYALVVWRLKNVIPRRLQLVYLGSGDVLTYDPVLADLERVERKLLALWEAIRQATETGDWRPRPTKLCGWCDHQEHCPEFGGTPPPYPLPVRAAGSAADAQGRMGPD